MTGAALTPVDIGHARYVALADPGTAFWALVDREQIAVTLAGGPLLDAYHEKAADFARELRALRFELRPSAVYVNSTERCNLDCSFRLVTGRDVDTFAPCRDCAIRHFCGAPCPAEAHEMNGGMHHSGAFCGFYMEQVRYAFRLIADGIANDYLWDGWDEGTETVFNHALR